VGLEIGFQRAPPEWKGAEGAALMGVIP